jgi:signal transduction histidine kinase/ligand-binding sensor domain-containing protein
LWFGTNDGLNKYDGYEFTHYKHEPGDNKSLSLGRVFSIFLDSRGRLWAGTDQGGLNLFDPKSDNFQRYLIAQTDINEGQVNDIRHILETRDGKLWVATYGLGLWLFDPEERSFTPFRSETINFINQICYDPSGDIWVATSSGVFILNKGINGLNNSGSLIPVPQLAKLNILSLLADNQGLIWIGTYGMGAYQYNTKSGNLIHFSTAEPSDRKLSHNIIRAFIEDLDGNILVGTGGGGIDVIGTENKKEGNVSHKLNYQYSLNTNIVYGFFRDRTENLWIGTYNGGVNVVYRHKDKFGHLKSYGGSNDLSNNAILAIEEDQSGNLWIGTDGGGLNVYDPESSSFRHFRHIGNNPQSISGDVVKSLAFDHEGILWIGTFNAGLTAFDIEKNYFKRYYASADSPHTISENHIWDIEVDDMGNIWLGTLGQGLDCYVKEENRFLHFRHHPDTSTSLSNDFVSALLFDSKGRLWIGTEFGGLNMLVDAGKGEFRRFERLPGDTISLSSNQISTIFEDSKGNLWIGTVGGGLNLYNEEDRTFRRFTVRNGLANNLICAILEDSYGTLWISTNNGLSRFTPPEDGKSSGGFRNFYAGDGLQSNEFSPQSACATRSGKIYLGGIDGINYFSPSTIDINRNIPKIVLTNFLIFNKPVEIGGDSLLMKQHISQTRELHLSYKQAVITFEFAALDFNIPSQNRYKYKLEGFEEDWNDVGNRRTATYTNLDPGRDYTFRVIGSNNDGVWNNEGLSIDIYIKPPFHKTWGFRLGLILLVICLIFLTYRLKVNSLQQHRKKLKLLVDARTSELLKLNKVLETQNQEIQFHREELLTQKESLILANQELEKNQVKITEQNFELEKHRNNLEGLVKVRTAELEKSKREAEKSDQLKSAFLSNMSHEIRTPMNAIIGFSALLAEPDINQREKDEFVQQINTNSEILLVLIDDILDLSKIESNQLSLSFGPIDIKSFIIELHKTFVITKKPWIDFRLETNIEDGEKIYSDRTRLRQILINLLDNAFKFTDHGYVKLEVSCQNEFVKVAVEDTGIGISTEILERIFDRFYKSDHPPEKIYRGAGLGLTITRKLVEMLGGKIKVTSQMEKGSRFEITLPFNTGS